MHGLLADRDVVVTEPIVLSRRDTCPAIAFETHGRYLLLPSGNRYIVSLYRISKHPGWQEISLGVSMSG
jgi:hypothetical protein